MAIENKLEEFGLSPKEVSLYLASLKLGLSNIQQLSDKSKIKRSTLYEIIKKLTEKNLLIKIKKNKRNLFLAQEPKNILSMVKQKEDLIQKLIPELDSIKNTVSYIPTFKIYEGTEELKRLHQEILQDSPKEILTIGVPVETIPRSLSNYLSFEWKPSRIRKGIYSKMILPTKYDNRKDKEIIEDKEELRTKCFLPKENYPFYGINIRIFNDNLILSSLNEKELFAVSIKSQEIAKAFTMIFNSFWNN